MTGVIGLFKTGGAELVRQHVEALLPPPPARYDIRPQGIVVWPEGDPAIEVLYDLTNGPLVAPRLIRGYPRRDLPMLPRSRLVFRGDAHHVDAMGGVVGTLVVSGQWLEKAASGAIWSAATCRRFPPWTTAGE